jgi:hypothetical protein
MIKTYRGNHEMADGWTEAFELREMYGSEWVVYTRNTDPQNRYISVKVAATQRVESKANYWLFWDKEKSHLGSRGADSKLLKLRPELFNFVKSNLEGI